MFLMAPNIALLCWQPLAYAFHIDVLGTSVCLLLMLKVITVLPLDTPQRQMPSAVVDIFIGISVWINNLLVFRYF